MDNLLKPRGLYEFKLPVTNGDHEGNSLTRAVTHEMAHAQERCTLEASAEPVTSSWLGTLERWHKKRRCQEAWKQRHRGAYLEQKRELAHRPEYLAKRRALYAQKQSMPHDLTDQGACERPFQ